MKIKVGTVEFNLNHHPLDWTEDGSYEPEVVRAIQHFVRSGDCVVDAGANLGFFTVLMSRIVGNEGLVLAFEPEQRAFDYLTKNVGGNMLNNVACLKTALYSHDTEVHLWMTKDLGYSSLYRFINNDIGCEKVQARTLDTLLINDHPRLIKLDCEGVEEEILHGAERILKVGVDCVIVELNFAMMEQSRRSDLTLRSYMASLGYDMFLINWDPPVYVEPTIPMQLRNAVAINVMFSTRDKVKNLWEDVK